jgi:hypothetical protein
VAINSKSPSGKAGSENDCQKYQTQQRLAVSVYFLGGRWAGGCRGALLNSLDREK